MEGRMDKNYFVKILYKGPGSRRKLSVPVAAVLKKTG